jgi:hypothetical protein
MLLSPASVPLFKMPWNRQFPLTSPQSQNSHIHVPALEGITLEKESSFTDVLKRRNSPVVTKTFYSS